MEREYNETELVRRLGQYASNSVGNYTKFFGSSPLELQAMDAIAFGITENGKKVWFLSEGYQAICTAMAKGEIVISNRVPVHAQAAWDLENDNFRLRPGTFDTPLGRSMMVHEMTHAIVDMAPGIGWTYLTNECAGYIAQAIYLKVTKTPLPMYANDAELTDVLREARALVDSFHFGGNTVGYGGITRADPELEKLRRAVAKCYPLYQWEERIPVGIFGLRSNTRIDTGQP